jgi:DHA1 family solute carrier family 18 vesicular amine transporter 1/2
MPLPVESSKRFLTVLGFSFAVEAALYSAVTPILPLLARRFDLTDSQTGILLSGYSAGLIAGSLLCVAVLLRVNARNAAVGGLFLLATSTFVFAWTDHYGIVLAARVVQGLAGGAVWTACISWLLGAWPIERRGEALGLAMSPAFFGTIAGPIIGTVAIDLGIKIPYTTVGLLCLGAAAFLLRMPRPERRRIAARASGTAAPRGRALAVLGAVAATTAGALIGLMNLAGPLVLARTGAAERTPGVAFVIAALLTVAAARPLGALVDRAGALRAALTGFLLTAVLLPPFGAGPGTVATAAVLILLLMANNACYIAAGSLLTREGENAGWSLYFATALTATVWGLGETVGALLAGVGLDVLGAPWSTAVGAFLAATTALVVFAVGRVRTPASRGPVIAPQDDPDHEVREGTHS